MSAALDRRDVLRGLATLPALTGGTGEPLSGESEAFRAAYAACISSRHASAWVTDDDEEEVYTNWQDPEWAQLQRAYQEAADVLARTPAVTLAGLIAKAECAVDDFTVEEYLRTFVPENGAPLDNLANSLAADLVRIRQAKLSA
jgi:hypothetical protein